jgi:hypothetical protein
MSRPHGPPSTSAWPTPWGTGKRDVPLLLRRAAEGIEAFGAAEIQGLLLHMVVNEFGNWPSITIYFRRDQPATE